MPGSRPRSRRSPSGRCAASSTSRRRSTRASPCSRASTRRRSTAATPSACASRPARGPWCGRCARTALIACWSRAASASSPTASPPRSASTRPSRTGSHIEGGRLAGTVGRPIVGAEGKRQALLEAAAARGIALADALAVGDGANDIPMLEAAGLGIAYHAKPAAAAAADARIEANDLTRAALTRRAIRGRSGWRTRPPAGSCRRRWRRARRRPSVRRRRSRCRCRRRRGC